MIRCVFTDVDGTILDPSHQITQRVKEAFAMAVQRGVRVVFATGRSMESTRKLICDRGLEPVGGSPFPGVYSQGCVVYGPGGESNIIYEAVLSKDVVRSVFSFWRLHKNRHLFSLVAYGGNDMYAPVLDVHSLSLAKYGERSPVAIGEKDDAFDSLKVNKLLYIAQDVPTAQELRREMEALLGACVQHTSSIANIQEVLPLGVSKGRGVEILTKHLGLDVANTMALGDAENDIEMIESVGVGVAMGNACEAVKKVANIVTATNVLDGWADAVESMLLLDAKTKNDKTSLDTKLDARLIAG